MRGDLAVSPQGGGTGFDYAKKIVLLNSDYDPWGCTDMQARPATKSSAPSFIFAKGQGHMGFGTYNQPMPEFSLHKEIIAANL